MMELQNAILGNIFNSHLKWKRHDSQNTKPTSLQVKGLFEKMGGRWGEEKGEHHLQAMQQVQPLWKLKLKSQLPVWS